MSSRRERHWKIRLTHSFIHVSKNGLGVSLFVCSLVCHHCSTFHEKLWGMINHRQERRKKNIIPHRRHSGIFKMARRAKPLCYALHHMWFPQTPLCPILTKKKKKPGEMMRLTFSKTTLPGQKGGKLQLQLKTQWHVCYWLSLICGGANALTVASSQLCLQVCFRRLLRWHHGSQASLFPATPLPAPSPLTLP